MSQPSPYRPVPLDFTAVPRDVQIARAREFEALMKRRRTVRHFSPEPVPDEVIDAAIAAAASAPSGANMQPWRFVVVRSPEVKRRIREAAEAEERESYERRMPADWLDALAPLGTDWHKAFLEIAPILIAVFRIDYRVEPQADGRRQHVKHYYVTESVGLACGFLLTALHYAGVATLTHTPSPMGFLSEILERPKNEKAFLLIPAGYPAEGAEVPNIGRKPMSDVRVDV